VLPPDVRRCLETSSKRGTLLEIVLDLGRRPEARFLEVPGGEELREAEVTYEELEAAAAQLGDFGGDNRAGLPGTLHRISCIRNRRGKIIGLTCRVGRAVTGHADMVRLPAFFSFALMHHLSCVCTHTQIRDLLDSPDSLLLLGRPGVGKTTVIRELARILSDDFHKRVVIIDTSSEIGGDGDIPHPAIGGARRMQVADPSQQHHLMIEAVENHMPEVVIVDEVSTEAEALACRTIAERGVQLVATAHGQVLANLLKNPTLSDLVGGIQSVTLGDDEARSRGTQKTILERKGPPTFPTVIEMRERGLWVAHDTQTSVDDLLLGRMPLVEVRSRDADHKVVVSARPYDVESQVGAGPRRSSGAAGDDDSSAWALRMGIVPDKDALINAAMGLYAGAPQNGGGKRGSNSPKMRAVAGGKSGRSAR